MQSDGKPYSAYCSNLRSKFSMAYSLMFVLPVGYLVYVTWGLSEIACSVSPGTPDIVRGLWIGMPASILMSLAAFVLINRSLGSVTSAAKRAEMFAAEMGRSPSGPADGGDEALKISGFVTDMIGELRQKLADVDRFTTELNEANRKLVTLAVHDGLTGLYNQKHGKHLLQGECDRASRFRHPLSVIMLDVDRFKAFNDAHGHLAGDQALRQIAGAIGTHLRRVDITARYGGEEFLVILPETRVDEARTVAERIRNAVAELAFLTSRGEPSHLTISAGVADFDMRRQPIAPDELIAAADKQLYLAKESGRNCVRSTES